MNLFARRRPEVKARSYELLEIRFGGQAERPSSFLWVFVILVTAYCGWVSSLPLFPTQDDAMHLYYTKIAQHLLFNSSGFGAEYSIRIPPPPYVLHYGLLLLLTSFLEPVTAEKCMVCLILVSTAFGFRFLARGVGPQGGLMALWIVPVLLSWPLFMGFHNYCLALSFSLWGYGTWLRARGTKNRKLWSALLLIVVVSLFTHPIPVLFLVGMMGVDLTLRILQNRRATRAAWTTIARQVRWDIACTLLGCLTLFYISLFLEKSSNTHDLTARPSRLDMLSGFVRLQWMCFGTGGLSTKLYRCGLFGALVLGIALGIRSLKTLATKRPVVAAQPLLMAALFLVIALPFLPPDMNGSEHFSDRLPILVWIWTLAAASSAPRLRPATRKIIAVVGCLFSAGTLMLADRLIRPVANDIARIEQDPVTRHKLGLLFDGPVQVQDERLTFSPHLRWVGGRYFRRTDAVLINAPWLNPPFPLPIQRRETPLTSTLSRIDLLDPVTLHTRLMNSARDRDKLLSSVDVLVFVGKPQPGELAPDPLLAVDAARGWACKTSGWYFVCEPTRQLLGQSR